jgi:hypothetical protein
VGRLPAASIHVAKHIPDNKIETPQNLQPMLVSGGTWFAYRGGTIVVGVPYALARREEDRYR